MNRVVVEAALEALRQLARKPQADGASSRIEARAAEVPSGPITLGRRPHCVRDHSIAVIDGRDPLNNSPKTSAEWEDWFQKWQPSGKTQ